MFDLNTAADHEAARQVTDCYQIVIGMCMVANRARVHVSTRARVHVSTRGEGACTLVELELGTN